VRRPVPARIAGRLVPVVLDLFVDEQRPLPGDESQERARCLSERHPSFEVRLGLEGVRLIVAEDRFLVAREHDRTVELGGLQRLAEPVIHDREMRPVLALEPRDELLR
jgi:hypothetical protein